MTLKRMFLGTVVMSVMIATAVVANPSESSAATVYRFRLSQFAHVAANVCVRTDVQTVCTGEKTRGHSEIYDVSANGLDGWSCYANVLGGISRVTTGKFSRYDVKECVLNGDLFRWGISTVS